VVGPVLPGRQRSSSAPPATRPVETYA
jgi:hypothetical protein